MMIRVGEAYWAKTAVIVGDVSMSAGVNVWFGSIIRGDVGSIRLGRDVNIQDGCILHTDHGEVLEIDSGVVVGHGAIVHGARIGSDSLIGMRACLLSGSRVGPECIIAAGSLVPENFEVPARSVVMGTPGRIVRQVSNEEVARIRETCRRYRDLAERYFCGEIHQLNQESSNG